MQWNIENIIMLTIKHLEMKKKFGIKLPLSLNVFKEI